MKSKGRASARVSCLGSSIELSVTAKDLPGDEVITYEVWVYNNGDDAQKVGTVFASRGSAARTAIIDDSVRTKRYFAIAPGAARLHGHRADAGSDRLSGFSSDDVDVEPRVGLAQRRSTSAGVSARAKMKPR